MASTRRANSSSATRCNATASVMGGVWQASSLASPMTSGPRLRFAPSPTGYFHVGGARTALFNWLLARQQGGTFILRIEDTDEARNHPQWVDGILNAMQWLGLDWDEGPFFQSDRADRHAEATVKLHAAGQAYYCDCTREQVDE